MVAGCAAHKFPLPTPAPKVQLAHAFHNHHQIMKILRAIVLAGSVALSNFAADTNEVTPSPSIAKDSRCFEMRTYYAAPGKLEELNKRFRDHTCALFEKHGMKNIGYWIPTEKDKGAENTLVYIIAHKSREEAKKSWAAFIADPEWKKVHAASEANGKLVTKIESVFLAATDFSPVK
jgi:hypothetical protein